MRRWVCSILLLSSLAVAPAWGAGELLIDASRKGDKKAVASLPHAAVIAAATATVDIGAMKEGSPDSLRIVLPDAQSLQLHKAMAHANANGTIWRGAIDMGNAVGVSGNAIFAFGERDAAGVIRTPTREWRLIPQGNGRHVLQEIDVSRLMSVDDAEFVTRMAMIAPPRNSDSIAASKHWSAKTSVEIKVLVVFDRRVLNDAAAAGQRAALLVEQTNVALAASGLAHVRLSAAHYLTDVVATGVQDQHQELLMNSGVRRYRTAVRADIVMLVSHATTSTSVCGVAPLLGPGSRAYGVVADNLPCDFTFEHEVAHLFSADHDVAAEDPLSTKDHAHGFYRQYPLSGDPGYIDIMVYKSTTNCPNNWCTREHWFSNPRIVDSLGYPTGTVSTHDNARAIDEEAVRVSQYSDDCVAMEGWDARYGNVTAGSPTGQPAVRRLRGPCGIKMTGSGAYVSRSIRPTNSWDLLTATGFRFYLYPEGTSGNTQVLLASAPGSRAVFSAWINGDLLTFKNGSGAAIGSVGLKNRTWNSIHVSWSAGAPGQLRFESAYVELLANGTWQLRRNPGSATVGNADDRISDVSVGQLNADSQRDVYIDAFEQTAPNQAFGRECRCDANDDGQITSADRSTITAEIGGIAAPGQPDCNEDGYITASDRAVVTSLIGTLAVCPVQ